VPSLLPWRLLSEAKRTSKSEWVQKLHEAHKQYGKGKKELEAKVVYLNMVKQYVPYAYHFHFAVAVCRVETCCCTFALLSPSILTRSMHLHTRATCCSV
jgi:hypothetical protein